jgi:hypothetical protein
VVHGGLSQCLASAVTRNEHWNGIVGLIGRPVRLSLRQLGTSHSHFVMCDVYFSLIILLVLSYNIVSEQDGHATQIMKKLSDRPVITFSVPDSIEHNDAHLWFKTLIAIQWNWVAATFNAHFGRGPSKQPPSGNPMDSRRSSRTGVRDCGDGWAIIVMAFRGYVVGEGNGSGASHHFPGFCQFECDARPGRPPRDGQAGWSTHAIRW